MIEALFFFLLLFPVWWLVIGYCFNCSLSCQSIALIIIIAGGIFGFFIAFACNGGAGGSSTMSSSAWRCLSFYLVVYNAVLARIIFSGKRKKE